MSRFDYLTPYTGPVVDGLEDLEKIYALEKMTDNLPIRTLPGEGGASAIYRTAFTDEQRKMVAAGADILVEILHYGGPLAPSRVMLLNDKNYENDTERDNMARWFCAQAKIPTSRVRNRRGA